MILGGMQTGKTALLESWLLALVSYLPAERLELTLVDRRDGRLQPYSRLPQVKEYVEDPGNLLLDS